MRTLNPFRIIALALACATLAMTVAPTHAAVIRAHGGNTFELLPTPTPGVLAHPLDGVARVSVLGNCAFHGDVLVQAPAAPDQPFVLKGTWRFTSTDGTTTLDAEVEGTATLDPANPNFANVHYEVKFTGGTGQMTNARGRAKIDGLAMFTSPSTGTAAWSLNGLVLTRGHNDHEDKDHDHKDR